MAARAFIHKLPAGTPDFASLPSGHLKSLIRLYRHRLGYWRDKAEGYAAAVERGEIEASVWRSACAEILRVHRLFMAAVEARNTNNNA